MFERIRQNDNNYQIKSTTADIYVINFILRMPTGSQKCICLRTQLFQKIGKKKSKTNQDLPRLYFTLHYHFMLAGWLMMMTKIAKIPTFKNKQANNH